MRLSDTLSTISDIPVHRRDHRSVVVTTLTGCVAMLTSLHPSLPFKRLNAREGALGLQRSLEGAPWVLTQRAEGRIVLA